MPSQDSKPRLSDLAKSALDEFDELLTDEEVSAITKVKPGTLRQWRARGQGPRFFRLSGRTVRHRRADVEAWLASRASDAQ